MMTLQTNVKWLDTSKFSPSGRLPARAIVRRSVIEVGRRVLWARVEGLARLASQAFEAFCVSGVKHRGLLHVHLTEFSAKCSASPPATSIALSNHNAFAQSF